MNLTETFERFIFGNLIYKLNKMQYLLLNLISFRRQIISIETLRALRTIEKKQKSGNRLTREEEKIIMELYNNKQILPDLIKDKVERQIKENSNASLNVFPVKSITFNLTHRCNFNCSYCYQNKYKSTADFDKVMTIEDIECINNYLASTCFDSDNMEEIIISGGEPLMTENIQTLNCIINKFNPKKFILFSNGLNLYKFKDKIDFEKIDEYQISLDGPDEVIKIVNKGGNDAFAKIIQGIKYIETINKKISIVVIWSKYLETYIELFIEKLKRSGILDYSNINIRFTLPHNYYQYGYIDKEDFDLKYINDLIKKINPILAKVGSYLEISSEVVALSSIIHREKNSRFELRYKRCNFTRSIPMIFEPNGQVYWCVCLGNRNGCIGRYKDGVEIDVSKILKFGNRTVFSIDKCSTCPIKYICGGGCVLPLTSCSCDIYNPVCGIFGSEYFWNNLESFV